MKYKVTWRAEVSEFERENRSLRGHVEALINDGRDLWMNATDIASLLHWEAQPEGERFWQMANILFDIEEERSVTPETVEVGATYTHENHPKATYLGVRLVNGCKTIVVQSSTDGKDGFEVSDRWGFWEGFRKV